MTEVEWLTCGDPREMFLDISSGRYPGDRKARLAAIAIARQGGCGSWAEVGHLIHAAERIVDGLPHDLNERDLFMAQPYVAHWLVAERNAFTLCQRILEHYEPDVENRTTGMTQASVLRDIIANPYRETRRWWGDFTTSGERGRRPVESYLTDEVLSLAQAAYEMRRPDSTLDPVRLAILADDLEETGCTDEEVLRHLRGEMPDVRPVRGSGASMLPVPKEVRGWCRFEGNHYRGCWALDLVLGKE